MQAHHMTNLTDIKHFMFAGHAVFTLKSKSTGAHYTFRVMAPDEKQSTMRFVSLRTGADDAHWSYFGNIRLDGESARYWHGHKAKMSKDAPGAVAFNWFLLHLLAGHEVTLSQMEFWHEGRCCRCGRELTNPESIARGIGPVCARGGMEHD